MINLTVGGETALVSAAALAIAEQPDAFRAVLAAQGVEVEEITGVDVELRRADISLTCMAANGGSLKVVLEAKIDSDLGPNQIEEHRGRGADLVVLLVPQVARDLLGATGADAVVSWEGLCGQLGQTGLLLLSAFRGQRFGRTKKKWFLMKGLHDFSKGSAASNALVLKYEENARNQPAIVVRGKFGFAQVEVARENDGNPYFSACIGVDANNDPNWQKRIKRNLRNLEAAVGKQKNIEVSTRKSHSWQEFPNLPAHASKGYRGDYYGVRTVANTNLVGVIAAAVAGVAALDR